jgi:hypothetical protein
MAVFAGLLGRPAVGGVLLLQPALGGVLLLRPALGGALLLRPALRGRPPFAACPPGAPSFCGLPSGASSFCGLPSGTACSLGSSVGGVAASFLWQRQNPDEPDFSGHAPPALPGSLVGADAAAPRTRTLATAVPGAGLWWGDSDTRGRPSAGRPVIRVSGPGSSVCLGRPPGSSVCLGRHPRSSVCPVGSIGGKGEPRTKRAGGRWWRPPAGRTNLF